MENNNPFEQAVNCFTKHERVTSTSNSDVNYMLIRALSMDADGYYAADTCNMLSNGCPKWAIRMLAHVLCPQKNIRRIGFIKKPENKLTEREKLLISLLAKHFNLSPCHAEETYNVLIEQGVDLKEFFGQKAVISAGTQRKK